MREILFRGKRLQGNNWIEGYFYKSDINYRERTSGKATLIFTPDCDTFIRVPEAHNSFMVHADTVGQYTGLTDKNGKRIFEGDIMEFDAYGFHYKGVVSFVDGNFGVVCNRPNASPFLDVAIKQHDAICVGNIHDNRLERGD